MGMPFRITLGLRIFVKSYNNGLCSRAKHRFGYHVSATKMGTSLQSFGKAWRCVFGASYSYVDDLFYPYYHCLCPLCEKCAGDSATSLTRLWLKQPYFLLYSLWLQRFTKRLCKCSSALWRIKSPRRKRGALKGFYVWTGWKGFGLLWDYLKGRTLKPIRTVPTYVLIPTFVIEWIEKLRLNGLLLFYSLYCHYYEVVCSTPMSIGMMMLSTLVLMILHRLNCFLFVLVDGLAFGGSVLLAWALSNLKLSARSKWPALHFALSWIAQFWL